MREENITMNLQGMFHANLCVEFVLQISFSNFLIALRMTCYRKDSGCFILK